ncbi:hypothetical protein C8R43DRAFT_1041980 [Mycena crocata]|nr:hypothetical protein C8R43DRAFT_1041980 [Mycena crocata]
MSITIEDPDLQHSSDTQESYLSQDDSDDAIPSNPNHDGDQTSPTIPSSKCIIYITSHGHRFGPFTHPSITSGVLHQILLQYDLRSLPNPPKNVRAHQTGLHKSLREWFFSRPEAVSKMEEVQADIDAAITTITTYPAEIYVLVFCEMGKHRSVAFVEELGRHSFFISHDTGSEKCNVEVRHRDVARGKHEARGSSRRQREERQGS